MKLTLVNPADRSAPDAPPDPVPAWVPAEALGISQGDTVQLKSGGPLMTVQVCSQDLASCVWFIENAERKDGVFHLESLLRISPND